MNFGCLIKKLNLVLEKSKCFSKGAIENISGGWILKFSQSKFLLPSLPELPQDRVINYSSPIFFNTKNPEVLAKLFDEAKTVVDAGFFQGDNLFTWGRNNSALEDEQFVSIWNKNTNTAEGQSALWSEYLLLCFGSHAIHIQGDFVECCSGVQARIKTMIEYFGGHQFPKKLWIYDVSSPLGDDRINLCSMQSDLGHGGPNAYVGEFDNVEYIKSDPSQILNSLHDHRIAYLNISFEDVSLVVSLLDALFDRVVPGGIVILGYYERSGIYRMHKQLEDQWFEGRNYRIFPLPTGQGFVIKR